ncbi:putative endopeptidase [Dyadobacter sp. BE34]|uniref:Endopeptidase n=1 Tax=Dyadobacter fermentans TaxID=94254 RepID=A0ABU1QQ99_9BACT|nr:MULTISPECIES: M13 family metallopeptidase [Dyadobacter]MDR6803287.1 putative endopeptidase [Dyadobacter fermentans]MDR7041028.1 putative endopeptidase [Dyadobacter sp. BE242]MDR7195431.1 putative endopeptidase [Dyadobacter sp. BE34]MDR7214024.1 putative endopeptidase [Dyadobacter sp. BE31]MDR7260838.1 putative endopeptidase [Dyadobacter sp. BE32]
MKSAAFRAAALALVVSLAGCKKEKEETDTTKVPGFDVSSLDSTAKACDDFDTYANGGWKKKNPIPGTESRWGAFGILDKENKEVRLKGIIEEITKVQDRKKGTEEQQIADYYQSFLDTTTVEKRALEPLKPYLDKINAVASLKDLAAVAGEMQKVGVETVTGFGVEGDLRNSKVNILYQGQNGLSLGERSYYDRTDSSTVKVRGEFVKHVDKMFSMAGFPEANPGQTILDFETKVAKLQLTNVELRDPVKTYNKMAFADFEKLIPDFDQKAFADKQDIKTDTLIVQNKAYLQNLNKLLKATPIATLKLYSKWQLLSTFAGYLPKKYDQEDFRFFATVMRGTKQQKGRVERAIRSTDGLLGMPLGKLFVKKYFPEEDKKKVSEMIENVRTVYGERIDKLTWMSDSTKAKAHKKLKAFTYKIGYPDKWKDYSSIEIAPDKLFENVISASLYAHKENVDKIGKEVDKKEWLMTPQTVNAYYNPLNNEVVFPAGILQPPFYNRNADDAINYGGIIAVIGHEFTHGFDDQGSQFDDEGNLKNWWTAADRANFDKLTKRYIDYFSGIEALPGFKINGALTIGENVADLGGLTLAYYALEKSFNGKEPAPIDGFTWQQRFFLGWAQVWHMNTTDEALRNQVQTDPHSPARDRINGPLPHLKEFQAAWSCGAGSKMVLPDSSRIVIW